MKIGNIDTEQKVLIIAEIGNNHEGDFDRACDMIASAAETGVDAVKFQTIIPSELVSSSETLRMEKLKSFQFSYEQFSMLKEIADKHGVIFLSTPFDLSSVHALNPIVPAFKVASGDNNFIPLIDKIIKTRKPLLLSCGLRFSFDLDSTLEFLQKNNPEYSFHDSLALLHCVSAYPTPPEEANLNRILELKSKFPYTIGYSDHTLGIKAPSLAVASGARIIEKHFTLSKSFSDFRDHQLSADPKEMAELVYDIRTIESYFKHPSAQIEKEGNIASRRSICARRNLSAGSKITWDDLKWIRPGGGLAPGQESLLLGKILSQDISIDEVILPDYLEE